MRLTLKVSRRHIDSYRARFGTAAREGAKLAVRRTLEAERRLVAERVDRGPSPKTDTGSLADAWRTAIITEEPHGARGYTESLEVDHPAARILDKGGLIRAVRGAYLRIPLNAEARAAGSGRMPDTFVVKSRAGNLIVARRSGDGIEPMYVLKKEVRIPATHYIGDAMARLRPGLTNLWRGAMREAFRAAGLGAGRG